MFEVEQKFAVPDLTKVRAQLTKHTQVLDEVTLFQKDQYLAHPTRDFSETDEALRVRETRSAGGVCTIKITYQGPRISSLGNISSTDANLFKTRREVEVAVSNSERNAKTTIELFKNLGFIEMPLVEKTRTRIQALFRNYQVEFALDQLGKVGEFVEIEVIAACQADVPAAERIVGEISALMELSQPITRSYLEMILENENSESKG